MAVATHMCEEAARTVRDVCSDVSVKGTGKDEELLTEMGTELQHWIPKLRCARDWRPFLAPFRAKYSRDCVERVTGLTIHAEEWKQIGLHAKFPGAHKVEGPKKYHRECFSAELVKKLLWFLDDPANLQRYAFGTKLLRLYGGR